MNTAEAAAPPRVVVHVDGLRVELRGRLPIVEDVSLEVRAGEILGLVGESGSGKTTTALALLGYAREGSRIAGGTVSIDGHALTGRGEAAVRSLRGRVVSFVPQNPASALNPALRVGSTVADMLHAHAPGLESTESVLAALGRVELPAQQAFARRFPHQLSGGQQQRVTIASALVCEPAAVVMDEPTTGLDVVTQARILDEVDRLRTESGVGVVYVSHDLAVVASIADRIAVMYAGRIVESGPAAELLARPRHPYTRGLIASIPDHVEPRRIRGIPGVAVGVGERPSGCAFAPRCPQRVDRCDAEVPPLEQVAPRREARCFEWRATPPLETQPPLAGRDQAAAGALLEVDALGAVHGSRHETIIAAKAVSFTLAAGECLALVGESGSGKTTIARCVAGLHEPAAGSIRFAGEPLAARAKARPREARRRIQIVFQNPTDSLNPTRRVADEIARPARVLRNLSRAEARAEVDGLLERVRLPARVAVRFPTELSGGELQRVAIARALAAQPDLVICDEITSALDVSVQAAVLELLSELRAELGLAVLFISHDLGVVASVADRILVLDRGSVCEQGLVAEVLTAPRQEYTKRLLAAAPRGPGAGFGDRAVGALPHEPGVEAHPGSGSSLDTH
jgi:peptide/nickel transport system ATP-binding protein